VAKTLIKLLGITFVFCDEAHVCLVLPGHCGSLILEKFVPSYNNSSSMHLYSIKVCYLVTVFCMLVIITPDLRLCNSDVYSCRYVIFRKYPTIDVWCVCACVYLRVRRQVQLCRILQSSKRSASRVFFN
jgi:hypothetical protein